MNSWLEPEPSNWWSSVEEALAEDIGSGDLTGGCIEPSKTTPWHIEAQCDGILCGIGIAEQLLSPTSGEEEGSGILVRFSDGQRIERGNVVIEGVINARRALVMERTVLNFLMHLSGVSTLTAGFVKRIEGLGSKIIDTRKTTPGLRILEKYAVRCGGGYNHRMGLYDGALIKDNHISACGSISSAIAKVKQYASHMVKIEVECESLDQVAEAVNNGADIILLDNMDPFMMREATNKFRGKALFEASGGISLETVRGVAQTGVDLISIGALTHSAPALPFHMEFDEP